MLAERLAGLIGVLLCISVVTFGLANAAPGDPATILLELQNPGVTPSREAVALYRTQLGLDDPAPLRYVRWLSGVLRGDLGVSYRSGAPVAAEIAERLPGTLLLAGASLALALAVGLPLGLLSATRPGSAWDLASRAVGLAGATLPSYVVSFLLVLLFAVLLGWLPAFGSGTPQHLVLPATALAAGVVAPIMRLCRASMLDALHGEYVRTARAKGLAEHAIVRVHALRNALLPVVTILGISAGNLLSGAVIVETIFSWHGIGKYAVDAIFLRDYPVIQGVVLYMAAAFVLISFAVDVAHHQIDPRLRDAGQ